MNRHPSEPPERPTGAPVRPFLVTGPDDGDGPDVPEQADGLRPFLLTAGRVSGQDASIAIETQVISTDHGRSADELDYERKDIVCLCRDPLSVAEIAAQLSLHLAVVRVLVGDLSAAGHLSVYLPNTDASTDVDTLLRVIRGLRAIG